MPRFFFDISDGSEVRDRIGRDIESYHEMRREALRVMTQLTAEEGEDSDGFTLVLKVRNAAGSNVLTLRTVCQIDQPTDLPLKTGS